MICPLPSFCVPLNIICSTQCEMPVMPACSLRDPTWYHTQNDTTGADRASFVIRLSPFGKLCRSKLCFSSAASTCAGVPAISVVSVAFSVVLIAIFSPDYCSWPDSVVITSAMILFYPKAFVVYEYNSRRGTPCGCPGRIENLFSDRAPTRGSPTETDYFSRVDKSPLF